MEIVNTTYYIWSCTPVGLITCLEPLVRPEKRKGVRDVDCPLVQNSKIEPDREVNKGK